MKTLFISVPQAPDAPVAARAPSVSTPHRAPWTLAAVQALGPYALAALLLWLFA